MATLEDDAEFVSVLYYGPYGTGKTTCMADMARQGTIKYIRPDRGTRVRPLRALGIPVDKIEPINELNPLTLEKMVEEWRVLLATDPGGLAGVCFDTMTEMVGRRAEVYQDKDWKDYVLDSKKARTEVDPLARFTVGDNRDRYSGITQELGRLVRHLCDLPCHIAFSAQQRTEAGKLSPDINPALMGRVMGYVTYCIRLEQDGEWPDGRALVVGYPKPTIKAEGKDRDGVLPTRFADPTFTRLLAYANGELDFKTDPVQSGYRDLIKKRKAADDAALDD